MRLYFAASLFLGVSAQTAADALFARTKKEEGEAGEEMSKILDECQTKGPPQSSFDGLGETVSYVARCLLGLTSDDEADSDIVTESWAHV